MPQLSDQVDRNHMVFVKELPALLQSHAGMYVLMHDETMVGFATTAKDAVSDGIRKFGQGNFSVQEITSHADDLGFYSYAGGALQA